MDRTLPINALAEIIARQTGYTEEFCRQFVVEMFKQITEGLSETGNVKIKGLGEFAINEERTGILFVPDNALADKVNEPFSIFEAEELEDDFDIETGPVEVAPNDAEPIEPIKAEIPETEALEEPTELVESTESADHVDPSEPVEPVDSIEQSEPVEQVSDKHGDGLNDSEIQQETEALLDVNSGDSDNNANAEETTDSSVDVADTIQESIPVHKRKFSWLSFFFGVAFGLILGAGPVYWIAYHNKVLVNENVEIGKIPVAPLNTDSLPDSSVAPDSLISASDSIVAQTETPTEVKQTQEVTNEAEPETDVIRTTLADLSRKHYDNFKFWVYIYLENKDKIQNPNQVEPGTVVVIPSRDKYGIDPRNSESIARADSISREIQK